MAARMGPLVLPRTPYAVSSARNNFKIDRYLNFSTGQISDRYSGGVNRERYRRTVCKLMGDKFSSKYLPALKYRMCVLYTRELLRAVACSCAVNVSVQQLFNRRTQR